MTHKFQNYNIKQIQKAIENQELTSEEYVSHIIERIEKKEEKIKAFITLDKEKALEIAKNIDRKIRNKEKIGMLAGSVIGIKDNISTLDLKTTCASKMLSEYYPPYDATVIKRLKEKDAIIIGKLNMDEFGMGSTTEYSIIGPTRNPWNFEYVAGGSSGGSAASVASGECTASLGSDTGGSIRYPASFCSVVGLKPTYGLVSRYGLISYANSLEQIGPIGRSVSDVSTMLKSIAGYDENDNTTISIASTDYEDLDAKKNEEIVSDLNKNKEKHFKIGLLQDLTNKAQTEVSNLIYRSIDLLKENHLVCDETNINSTEYALPSYYTIASAEASSNLARYDNIRYGFNLNPEGYEWNSYYSDSRSNFGAEVKRRIFVGTYVLSSGYYGKYYMKAQRAKSMIKNELKKLFQQYDILALPTVPILPFKIGEKIDDPLKMYLTDIYTVIANLAGIPAISIPVGFSGGLPVGIQFMADELKEKNLLAVATILERMIDIKKHPDIF